MQLTIDPKEFKSKICQVGYKNNVYHLMRHRNRT